MKKKFNYGLALVLIFVLMFVFSLTAFAADNEVHWNYTIENNEVIITGFYNFNGEELVIPDTLGGLPVTSIGDKALKDNSTLQKVTIPGSIREVGISAFSGCSALQTVVFSEGLTTIGREAFWGCKALETVQFPTSLTDIGSYAFNGCNNLKEINIPENVQTIGGDAFLSCLFLEAINVDEANMTYYSQDGILYNKDKTELLRYPQSKLDKSFSIPGFVTTVHREAFSGCRYLESVIVPGSVINMEMAFLNFDKLKEVVVQEGVTKISDKAFSKCWSLQKVTLPNSVVEIGDGAFGFCKNLQEIQLPDNLQKLGYRSFSGCTVLTKIFIPETVTDIGGILTPMSKDVFADCNLDNLCLYVRQGSKAYEYAEMHDFNYKVACFINVTAEANGSAIGSGMTGKGEEITLQAEANQGYQFAGWYNGSKKLSNDNPYKFLVDEDLNIIAKFTKINQGGGGGSSSSKDDNTTVTPKPDTDSDDFFVDVKESDWYYVAVKDVYNAGLMNGVDTTHFEPNANITRGMFVTILHRLAGKPQLTADNTNPFTDVSSKAYYAYAVIWANANGIIKGVSETAYAPDQSITREQMAAIVYRYVVQAKPDEVQNFSLEQAKYADTANISPYSQDAVNWCSAKGIMNGDADNKFVPLANATRAEAAAVILRVHQLLK